MKRIIYILCLCIILLCGCTQTNQEQESSEFTVKDGHLVNALGVEYSFLAVEVDLYHLGEMEFVGSIQGEEKTDKSFGILPYQTGMYSIKNGNDNILIRRAPNNEWRSYFRKSELPTFDYSADNCIRMEFVHGSGDCEEDSIHVTCCGGITDKLQITEFLANIRLQKNPHEAGLYDLVTRPDGSYENCYRCGVIYGFFEEEPNIVIRMPVTSYNDLAYSIRIGENEYVLPKEWLDEFLNSKCLP